MHGAPGPAGCGGGSAIQAASVETGDIAVGLRIAVGGFMHETNTFVRQPTAWEGFVRAGPWPTVTAGRDVLRGVPGITLAIAYLMQAAEKAGHVMLPLAWGGAMPGGKVTSEAFERMA